MLLSWTVSIPSTKIMIKMKIKQQPTGHLSFLIVPVTHWTQGIACGNPHNVWLLPWSFPSVTNVSLKQVTGNGGGRLPERLGPSKAGSGASGSKVKSDVKKAQGVQWVVTAKKRKISVKSLKLDYFQCSPWVLWPMFKFQTQWSFSQSTLITKQRAPLQAPEWENLG